MLVEQTKEVHCPNTSRKRRKKEEKEKDPPTTERLTKARNMRDSYDAIVQEEQERGMEPEQCCVYLI